MVGIRGLRRDAGPGNVIVAQALLYVSDAPPAFIRHWRRQAPVPKPHVRFAALCRKVGGWTAMQSMRGIFGAGGEAVALPARESVQPAHARSDDCFFPFAVRKFGALALSARPHAVESLHRLFGVPEAYRSFAVHRVPGLGKRAIHGFFFWAGWRPKGYGRVPELVGLGGALARAAAQSNRSLFITPSPRSRATTPVRTSSRMP